MFNAVFTTRSGKSDTTASVTKIILESEKMTAVIFLYLISIGFTQAMCYFAK